MKNASIKPQWFQILLALADRDLHGYGIMSEVLERTRGRMRLWPGMLYGSLRQLSEAGLIGEVERPEDSPEDRVERHFHRITPAGKRLLAEEVSHLEEIVRTARARKVLGA